MQRIYNDKELFCYSGLTIIFHKDYFDVNSIACKSLNDFTNILLDIKRKEFYIYLSDEYKFYSEIDKLRKEWADIQKTCMRYGDCTISEWHDFLANPIYYIRRFYKYNPCLFGIECNFFPKPCLLPKVLI
jgi:hypothetical protein